MIKKFLKKFNEIFEKNFEIIYSIYFPFLITKYTAIIVEYPVVEMIAKSIRYVFYIIFFIRILNLLPEYWKNISIKKWKSKSKIEKFMIILYAILFISIFINFIKTNNKRIIVLLLVLLAAYKMDYKKIIRYTMIMQIIMTSIITLMAILGLTVNYAVIREDWSSRYSMGFMYPSNLSQLIFFISLLYLYDKKFNVDFKDIFIIQVLNNLVYFITDSKTEFIFLEFIIIVAVLYKLNIVNRCKQFCKKILSFFAYTFSIYPIISFVLVLLYPLGGIFKDINFLLSNRLQQPYDLIKLNGLTIFGKDIRLIGFGFKDFLNYGIFHETNYIDNEYIQMLIKEGVAIVVIFIIILNVLLIILNKQKKYYELFLCSVYLIFGILNPRIIDLTYCPILFIIIPTFIEYFNKKK